MNKERLAKLAGIVLKEGTRPRDYKHWVDNHAKNIEDNIDGMYFGPDDNSTDNKWGEAIKDIWVGFKQIFNVKNPQDLPSFELSRIMVDALQTEAGYDPSADKTDQPKNQYGLTDVEAKMEDYCDKLERAFLDHAENVYGIRRDY